jgi:hypothetical protein
MEAVAKRVSSEDASLGRLLDELAGELQVPSLACVAALDIHFLVCRAKVAGHTALPGISPEEWTQWQRRLEVLARRVAKLHGSSFTKRAQGRSGRRIHARLQRRSPLE